MNIIQYQLLPDLTAEEYAALKADIAERGVMVPVEYDEQGSVLDGHHRVRACQELGVTDWPRVTRLGMTEQEKTEHILALNLDRRHLSKEQRRELVAKLRGQGWSTRRIADKLNASVGTIHADSQVFKNEHVPRTIVGKDGKHYPARKERKPKPVSLFNASDQAIDKAKEVIESGAPDLVAAMDQEDISVNQAAKIAKLDVEIQQAIVETIKAESVKPQEAMRRVKAAMIAEQEAIMPSGKYRVFYADPPWAYSNKQPDYFSEQRDHYPVMAISELCALPIQDMAMDNAVLFLWVTSPILEEVFEIINIWGFKYKASFIWDKVKHVMGHYNSVRHELLLICVRGSCQPDIRKLFDSVVTEERTEHSRKPTIFYEIIETLYTTGPYLELFARNTRKGWEAYSFESG